MINPNNYCSKTLYQAAGLLSFILVLLTMGCSDMVEPDANSEYALTKYHIDIQVNEDNTFLITEEIRAHYHVNKHGINRAIPLRNTVVRLDGTK